MKRVRTYKLGATNDGWGYRQKTTYITDEKEYFSDLWENDRRKFNSELRYILDLYDKPSQFDGDTYVQFEFYLSSPGHITVVEHGGYDV